MSDSPALNNTFLEAATAAISNVEGNLASCENNPITLVGVTPDFNWQGWSKDFFGSEIVDLVVFGLENFAKYFFGG